MTSRAGVAAVLLALLALAGCTTTSEPRSVGRSSASSSSASSSSAPSAPASTTLAEVCAPVRAGITAYNAGDFEETVADFEQAIPLAKAWDDGSDGAALMVQAVTYYARLAPDDYPAASRSSKDFAKYKLVTLTLCTSPGEEPLVPESTGPPPLDA